MRFVESLNPVKENTIWGEYSRKNTYQEDERNNKYKFISQCFKKK